MKKKKAHVQLLVVPVLAALFVVDVCKDARDRAGIGRYNSVGHRCRGGIGGGGYGTSLGGEGRGEGEDDDDTKEESNGRRVG